MREETIAHILCKRLIVIVRKLPRAHIVALGEALQAGGIELMEVTFDPGNPGGWRETCESIRALRQRFGEEVRVGAGTVLRKEQVDMACEAGASYIVSPNADPRVIGHTRARGLVSLPGCMTPSEMQSAHEAGADFIKVFPAGTLGAAYIKAVRAPLSHLRLLAVGGVNERNAADFIGAGCCGLGVGGNLVDKGLVAAGSFGQITSLAAAYVRAVEQPTK